MKDHLSSPTDRTFILGVGAQKAGTSWLYKYLAAHDDVLMSPLKEIHFLDTRFRPDSMGRYTTRFVRRLRAHIRNPASYDAAGLLRPTAFNVVEALVERLSMEQDERAYTWYFCKRLRPNHRAFGEITPAYCLVPEKAFTMLRSLVTPLAARIRVVFLMRDPIERFHSAVRHAARENRDVLTESGMRRHLMQAGNRERTAYHITLRTLRRAFAPEELHVEFYESLFTEEAIRALCAFLGLDFRPPDFATRYNASPAAEPLPTSLRAAARAEFDEVYREIRAQFGDRVPPSWSG